MFFPLKNHSLNRKRSRVAFPEHLVPLKSPFIHVAAHLSCQQTPIHPPKPNSNATYSWKHFPTLLQLFLLLYSSSIFKPISLVTSTFSTSFTYVFPSLDCEQLQRSGLVLFISVSPVLRTVPYTKEEHTVETHSFTQLFIHPSNKFLLSLCSVSDPGWTLGNMVNKKQQTLSLWNWH